MIKTIRQLRQMNQKEAHTAYKAMSTPILRQRMRQQHYPRQQDSPPPMTITHPLESLSSSSSDHANEAPTPRINPIPSIHSRQKCNVCHKLHHTKRWCPKYRCKTCRKTQPGHFTHECPYRPPRDYCPDQEDWDNHYDAYLGDNMNGEQ